MIHRSALFLLFANLITSTLLNLGCNADYEMMSDEIINFENTAAVDASEETELVLEEQSSDEFFYDPWFYYGYYAYAPYFYGYYGYPYLTPYVYGLADYYTIPLAFEVPVLADYPVLIYEHPFYAPYLLGIDPFDDDE